MVEAGDYPSPASTLVFKKRLLQALVTLPTDDPARRHHRRDPLRHQRARPTVERSVADSRDWDPIEDGVPTTVEVTSVGAKVQRACGRLCRVRHGLDVGPELDESTTCEHTDLQDH